MAAISRKLFEFTVSNNRPVALVLSSDALPRKVTSISGAVTIVWNDGTQETYYTADSVKMYDEILMFIRSAVK